MPKTPLGRIFFRSFSLLLLLTFSFQQVVSAFPVAHPFSSSPITEKLRSLNAVLSFERFLREEYNKDAQGKTEHQRRTEEIQGIINSVDQALRIYFGFASGTLNLTHLTLLKLLRKPDAVRRGRVRTE